MNCSLEFQWSVRHVNVYSSGNRVTRDEAATPSESVSVQELFRTTTNHHWTRKWKRGPEMWNSSRAKTAQRKAKKQEKSEIGKAEEQFLTRCTGSLMERCVWRLSSQLASVRVGGNEGKPPIYHYEVIFLSLKKICEISHSFEILLLVVFHLFHTYMF